ncbi:DUF3810 domain-containing protein [Winogradskyella maritima]|uniref:DUF3810 domain-containing protein n=1 Tax=Winogradskyella maritima TaxID=1517766 RepID=A0ABV8AHQ7_9FLAO|nr:DUF3810 domain-containing protein [Winogradskyella maritima]
MQQLKTYGLPLSGFVVFLLNQILKSQPEFVERFYSNGIYVYISKAMRFVFGWLPFSVGDILYTLAILLVLRWLINSRKRLFKDTKAWGLELLSTLSIAYIAFHVLWAFNYYRQPLHIALDIDNEYTIEELSNVIDYLISEANTAHSRLSKVDSLKIEFPYSKYEILDKVPDGYVQLHKEFPKLNYQPHSIKTSMYSTMLTYMGFSGYLNPFTNEAQVDILIPKFKLPTTGSHEVAHQLGFAAENEANFIGGLAAINNPDPYFQYSGRAFALRHCLYDLFKRDQNLYEAKLETINKGILTNYQEVRDFWMSYQNPLEPAFKTTYDSFLKANNQSKGMESYSYVVALFVNYFQANTQDLNVKN